MELAYRGTNYHGWQTQANGISVQEVIEKKLSTLLRQSVGIVGSGRTDSGVHAGQQFAHFDLEKPLGNIGPFVHALNCILPADIAVRTIFPVDADAHARYSAVYRYYQYRIARQKDPFREDQLYVFQPHLDVDRMNEVGRLLREQTDFQSFSKVRTTVAHFRCEMDLAEWRHENGVLVFHTRANRFLYGMVRALVGTMLEVGQGRMSVEEFQQIMRAKDRRKAGRSAPPGGLFLVEVGYPPEIIHHKNVEI